MTARARVTGLVLSLLLICSAASAEEMVMTLDGVGVTTCDTQWTEGSCVLRVVETIEGDESPPGSCSWSPEASGVALMGARLEIDATGLQGVEEVQIDLVESSGNGHTKIFLYEAGTSNLFQFMLSTYGGSPSPQTIPIFVVGSQLGKIIISASDALITEVRLNGFNLVDTEKNSWGTLKARW